jgi:hypothetical protein
MQRPRPPSAQPAARRSRAWCSAARTPLLFVAALLLACLPSAAAALPALSLERGVWLGGNARLRHHASSRNITFAALGGSVTIGHGTSFYNASWFALLETLLRADAASGATSGGGGGDAAAGLGLHRASGPQVEMRFVNAAVAGSNTEFTGACVNTMLTSDATVVFLEFTLNDGGFAVADALTSYEHLLRSVLAFPARPAVVLVHVPNRGLAYGAEGNARGEAAHAFTDTHEDALHALAAFYDLSSVSLRDAAFHAPGGLRPLVITADYTHLNDAGHAALAALAAHLVLSAVAAGRRGEEAGAAAGAEWGEVPAAPMMAANTQRPGLCVHGLELRALAAPPGWTFVDESLGERHHRYGLVARAPGAALVVQFGTPTAPVELSIGYLQSYEGMGNASARTPRKKKKDKKDAKQQDDYTDEKEAPAAAKKNCTITVTLLNTSALPPDAASLRTGGRKFKLTGFMSSYAWAPTPELHGFAILNKLAKGAMEDGDGRDWFGAWDGKHAQWTITNGGGR